MGGDTEASSSYMVMATMSVIVVVAAAAAAASASVVEVVSGDCTDEGFWGKICEKRHPMV